MKNTQSAVNRVQRLNEIRDKLSLSHESIDEKPVDIDWTAAFLDGSAETIRPDFSEKEYALNFLENEGVHPSEDDDLTELAESTWEDNGCGHPMMNYYYPIDLPHDSQSVEDLQAKLHEVGPVVLVLLDDEPVLALAGGGMDLSWEICWAYILLGSYPPFHFCRLPNYAGKTACKQNLTIIAACQESCRAMASRVQQRIESLDGILDSLTEE